VPRAALASPTENSFWGVDWPAVRARWRLDPAVAHLNHGSFGATTARVVSAQDRWRRRAHANPMRYSLLDEPAGVLAARQRAAEFLGTDAAGLAMVSNATTAISTVLATIELAAGDELVVTNHCYGAIRIAVERAAGRVGARVVEVALPVDAEVEQICAGVESALSAATRLLVIDHITSPTARLLPVARIVAAAHRASVPVLVDAAHAPGQIPVDVAALGADFWTGNFHKWPCAARGTAVLGVAPEWRSRTHSLVTSWDDAAGFPASFDQSGTQDRSAWLALGDALDELDELSWDRLRAHGSSLAEHGQQVVAESLGVPARSLWRDPELWMRCVPLPAGVATTPEASRALWHTISDRLGCEVGVTSWQGRGLLRLSAHAYNAPADYARLARGLRELLR
jgi:isopenicillin-N epimerase